MDPRTTELLNLELDGQLDAYGRAELDALLGKDPAARAQRAQLHAVATALEQAPAPELPADFHDAVLHDAAMRGAPAAAPARRTRWQPRRAIYALAASVFVAVVVAQFIDLNAPGRPDQVSGTMAAPSGPSVVVEATEPVLVLQFTLPAAAPAELVIELPGEGELKASADTGRTPRVEGRRIVVSDAGSGPFRLRVEGAGKQQEFKAILRGESGTTPVARLERAPGHSPP